MPFTHAAVKVPALPLGPLRGVFADLDRSSISGQGPIRPKAKSALGGPSQHNLRADYNTQKRNLCLSGASTKNHQNRCWSKEQEGSRGEPDLEHARWPSKRPTSVGPTGQSVFKQFLAARFCIETGDNAFEDAPREARHLRGGVKSVHVHLQGSQERCRRGVVFGLSIAPTSS